MVALEVKKGTKGQIIRDGQEWTGNNFREFETTKDLLFFAEEIAIDPLFKLGQVGTNTIGAAWALAGWYGFRRQGYVLLVPFDDVHAH